MIDVFSDGRRGDQQIGVGGGDCRRKDTCTDKTCEEGGEHIGGHQDENVFRMTCTVFGIGTGIQRTTDDTDEDGSSQGNQNPDGCNTAGQLQFLFVTDCHEAQKNLRHTEVT